MKNCLILFIIVLFAFNCQKSQKSSEDSGLTVSKAMGEVRDNEFAKALQKKVFQFPKDHGPHPDFRTEWWYFTGNLVSENNRRFGYQFTIFRTGLTREKPLRKSRWNSNQIYMAHFAVTDIDGGEFYFSERFSREGNDLSGAQVSPLKIWQEDWHISQISDEIYFELPVLNIAAESEEMTIDFSIQAVKPFVLQGNEGLSQKGEQPGNASYYYSYTRLKTMGAVRLKEAEFQVSGMSWLDREWSTSALSQDQAGWDWFALQLDDSTEIMYYQMRKTDGRPDRFSKGIFVQKDGTSSLITRDEVTLEVLNYWESPNNNSYPSGWRLQIPERSIDLTITPAIKNQLLEVTIRYWEGAVTINGTKNTTPIKGRGYVELTGY